jgi:hypothetical protein
MADDNASAKPPMPLRARRWSAPASSRGGAKRIAFRLIGIPVLAVAGVLVFRGLQERLTLPECDSARAKATLSDVLKQLKVQPLRYGPIKTLSTSNKEVVCHAVLPLADGAIIDVDYTFFWQGSTAQMRYSLSRRETKSSELAAPLPATR